MNIIISGANGFIGGDLLALLKDHGHMRAIGTTRGTANEKGDLYQLDLTNRNSVENFINEIKKTGLSIDVFVHCAAILADKNNHDDPALFTQNNLITQHVIEVVKALNISALINLSTIGVYPNSDGEYSEQSATRPSQNFECLYSLAKFCSEELFNFYLATAGCRVVNLRLAQVYGDRMRQDRIFKIMENEMKASGKISVWGNGERVSNFVPVTDVLETILYFIEHPASGLFNVGGENLSYKQLAEKVIAVNSYKDIQICPINKGVCSKIFINSEKLKKQLSAQDSRE